MGDGGQSSLLADREVRPMDRCRDALHCKDGDVLMIKMTGGVFSVKTTNNTGRTVTLSCRLDLRTGDQGSTEDQDLRTWCQGSTGDQDLRTKVQDHVGYSVFGDEDLDDGEVTEEEELSHADD